MKTKRNLKDNVIAWHRKAPLVHANLRASAVVLVALSLFLLGPSLAWAAGVQALFNLESPAGGPFPSDRFTVADPSHNTGRRVQLPKPDCRTHRSDCEDLDVINTLDGFNLQPRLSVPFSGEIDPETVTSESVFLVRLGSTLRHGDHGGQRIGINQVVWDPATHTLHAESDALLEQHTRYVLVVTRGVRDRDGDPVAASERFRRFLGEEDSESSHDPALAAYRRALARALRQTRLHRRNVAAASLFTTQSVTAVMEKIRDQIKAAVPAPADFRLGPGGTRTVFPLSAITSIAWRQHTGTAPSFTTVALDLAILNVILGSVGTLAFGKYRSPFYQAPGEFIPPVPTRRGTPHVQRTDERFFNLFLPAGPKPEDGWPVAIFAHGSPNGNKNSQSLNIVASMAAHGIATIAINATGHGFGPLGTLTVSRSDGLPVTFPDGGRAFDQNGDGVIGPNEGAAAAPPRTIIRGRDGFRQTVADLMQLVQVIKAGMDVDGDGVPDLDTDRIYFVGVSAGMFPAAMLLAVDPDVRAGVLTVAGGPAIEFVRLSPVGRPSLVPTLAGRVPSLINLPGPTPVRIDGFTFTTTFNENLPLRDQPPLINQVPGAMALQQWVENIKWAMQSGDVVAHAVYLQKSPLDGVPAKSVIIQFARGDQTIPNPTTTALLRAGDLADCATFYRHDLAFAADPRLPRDPHSFMLSNVANPAGRPIALAAQRQVGVFFASDGEEVIDPDGDGPIFEVPIVPPLPEDFGFIP